MFDLRAADSLLIDASKKLLSLRQQEAWKNELPSRCPPILWFGNAQSPKQKVLTIGANPSRREYLRDSATEALDKVGKSGDESLLSYLEPRDNNRFRVLDTSTEPLEQIVKDAGLRAEIIQGYIGYFSKKPYKQWFGNSGKVEGFLRGLGASFFGEMRFQAIHIDLLPFATLSDFKNLDPKAANDLFSSGWPGQTIAALLRLLEPLVVIVFGNTNAATLAAHVDTSESCLPWMPYPGCAGRNGRASYQIGFAEGLGARIVGLSVNLGNPRGFDTAGLREFGSYIGKRLGLDHGLDNQTCR